MSELEEMSTIRHQQQEQTDFIFGVTGEGGIGCAIRKTPTITIPIPQPTKQKRHLMSGQTYSLPEKYAIWRVTPDDQKPDPFVVTNLEQAYFRILHDTLPDDIPKRMVLNHDNRIVHDSTDHQIRMSGVYHKPNHLAIALLRRFGGHEKLSIIANYKPAALRQVYGWLNPTSRFDWSKQAAPSVHEIRDKLASGEIVVVEIVDLLRILWEHENDF